MNAAGSALAWCAVQIALVGAATLGVCWLVGKLHQAASGFAVATGLAVVFCLSAAAASPWPRWSFLSEDRPREDDPDADRNRSGKGSLWGAVAKALGAKGPAPAPGTAISATPAPAVVVVQSPPEEPAPTRFSRSILGGLRGPRASDRRGAVGAWRWTASLAVMFAAGLALGGAKLLLAVGAVSAVRRRSHTINDARLVSRLTALQDQLGTSRPIELRESHTLAAPATMGWRRPMIVLPQGWRTWSDDECRAVLAHEIAHVERGDYLMWLAAQLALVLHFYHPAVHWLAARIRLEQEFAADETAAALLGNRRSYLTALARLALRTPAPSPVAAPSFVSHRGALMQRVERLRGGRRDLEGMSVWASKFAAAVLLLTAGVAAAGFRGESIWKPKAAEPAIPILSPAPADQSQPVEVNQKY